MNKFLIILGYIPIAIILVTIYAASNLIMLPFAYLTALLKKLQLILLHKNREALKDFFLFFTIGLILLTISVFVDSKDFALHLFSNKV